MIFFGHQEWASGIRPPALPKPRFFPCFRMHSVELLVSVPPSYFGKTSFRRTFTAIIGAYYLGTFLVPEAKTYRFLADVLNDLAVIIDMFSPILGNFLFPGARALGLCTSAALRALCGVVAGGSKAAITLHFATPSTGMGDVGDLNAKDGSKETVLALAGMLVSASALPSKQPI